MRAITIWGRDLVFPYLGWSRVRNFKNISEQERTKISKGFEGIEEALREGQNIVFVIQKYRELTTIMMESNDLSLRALGSQIKMSVLIFNKMTKGRQKIKRNLPPLFFLPCIFSNFLILLK